MSSTPDLRAHILLLDDQARSEQDVNSALRGSEAFLVTTAHSLREGLECIAGHSIAAVLLNPFLPDSQGADTVRALLAKAPSVPLLLLVTEAQVGFAVNAVADGANDYLLPKHLDSYCLPRALQNAIDRQKVEEALYAEKDRALVTLNSIGDAVLCTDAAGLITFLNPVAQRMTGWSTQDAVGHPLAEVFRIMDGDTRETAADPLQMAMDLNRAVGLTSNCILIRKDGEESAIEDSAAPIHDRAGRIIGAVIVFHDVSAARAMTRQMSHAVEHDALTGILNRVVCTGRLEQAISLAKLHKKMCAVMFLDLDDFKSVNDTLGHAMGDTLLQAVAKRLTASLRDSDTVARHGGDEFVVLLPEIVAVESVVTIAKKLLDTLRQPYLIDEHVTIQTSASIGISLYPDDGFDSETLLQNADLAMYAAKKQGRGTLEFFKEAMMLQAQEQRSMEQGLRSALENNEFILHYQPKIRLKTGRITGAEALIRWRRPGREMVHPCDFIGIAEESGLIVPMGRWILQEACERAITWHEAGGRWISVSVNLCSLELQQPEFLANVKATLAKTSLPAYCLEFELTEGVLMDDVDGVNAVLKELRAMGIQIAVDDFGTGYSSLSYLHQFPVDILKIDRTFVQQITEKSGDRALVSTIIAMGKTLNCQVVAEGVETEEQRQYLLAQGCDEAQGFLFSRPVPGPEFLTLLTIDEAFVQ